MGNVVYSSNAYVSFQVRFSPELKDKLLRRSLETGISQREIVANALTSYLRRVTDQAGGCDHGVVTIPGQTKRKNTKINKEDCTIDV